MSLWKARTALFLTGLAEALLVAGGAVLALAALWPRVPAVWVLAGAVAGGMSLALALRDIASRLRVAWAVERANPQLGEHLVSWLELRSRVSPEVSRALLQRIEEARPSPWKLLRVKPLALSFFLVGADALLLRIAASPRDFLSRAHARAFVFPERPVFFSDRGTSLKVILARPGAKASLLLVGPTRKAYTVVPGESTVRTGRLEPGRYEALLTLGKDTLARASILSVARPYLRSMEVLLFPPGYARAQVARLHNPPSITGHQGSVLIFSLDHTGDSASLVWNGKTLPGDTLNMEEDGILEVEIWKGPLRAKSPRRMEISVIPDNPPTVRIVSPQGDIYLPDNERVPALVQAEDDMGVAGLWLAWEFQGQRAQERIPIKKGGITASGSATASLEGMNMMPGDEALVWAEAVDTRGQSSRSPSVRVRFPSMEEIFGLSSEASSSASERAGDLRAQAEALGKKMREINELLKSSRDLSWEERERVQRALSEAQEMSQQVAKTMQEAQSQFQELSGLPNYDPDLLERFAEAQRLLQESMTEDMKKALEDLQRALARLDKRAVEKAMEQLALSQEELAQRLEQAAELFKRFAQEAKLQSLAEEARRLAEEQEALRKAVEEKGTLPELAEKQSELASEIENLQKEVKELGQELSDQGEAQGEKLEEIADQELAEAGSEAQRAASRVSQGQRAQATESQSKAASLMNQAAQALSGASCSLTSSRKKEIAEAIARIRQEIIFTASRAQSLGETKDPGEFKARAEALTHAVKATEGELGELAKKTALLPGRVRAYLAGARRLFSFMAQGQSSGQAEAVAELNLAALALYEAQQAASGCSGTSTGMAEAMKRLARMAQAQAEMNAQAQSILQALQSGGMSPEMAGQRLLAMAAEQEAMRRQLQALKSSLEASGDARGLEKALEGALEEMKKAEDMMRAKRIDEDLLRRQQRIYNRLLEAQQSVRQQEFSPKRESETAKPYTLVSPKPSPRKEIRKSLLGAERSEEFWRYPPEMQKLIKAYYRTLLEE